MTGPRHRPAHDRAADIMQAVRNDWWPTPVPPTYELDAIPLELLHELADERQMNT